MVPLYKVYIPDTNISEEIEAILRSGNLYSGKYVNLLESKIRDYIQNPYVLVTGTYNHASLISLALFDLKNGDEVIASPMSCLASTQPILNFGCKMKWADIDPKTGTLDPSDVKSKINKNTKIILHYHWGGYPGYVDEINEIGRQFGIPVIDDCIESFGSQYKGKQMGSQSTNVTSFSLQTVRLPSAIDGGVLTFNDRNLYEKACLIRDYGINRKKFREENGEISSNYDIYQWGYNALMNEINAYICSLAMDKIQNLIDKQRINSKFWDNYCSKNFHESLNLRNEIIPNYWIYSFLSKHQEDDLIKIRNEGYWASKVHLRNDIYSCFGNIDESLKGVKEFSETQLSVPSGWWVN